ncbi:hypothetical protein [Xanthomonas campestris]|uniref:hypothetical protein n=1 Tax=Xanthomonas campestris TaxID=339 RepID=UPI00137AAC82|nr:hypothetical protein [Xanthomonas campestris]
MIESVSQSLNLGQQLANILLRISVKIIRSEVTFQNGHQWEGVQVSLSTSAPQLALNRSLTTNKLERFEALLRNRSEKLKCFRVTNVELALVPYDVYLPLGTERGICKRNMCYSEYIVATGSGGVEYFQGFTSAAFDPLLHGDFQTESIRMLMLRRL